MRELTRIPTVAARLVTAKQAKYANGIFTARQPRAIPVSAQSHRVRDVSHKAVRPCQGVFVMDNLKNIGIEEPMLLVAQSGAPVPATGLPAGSHAPELRFVLYSSR